jgi:hypothetical protein
VTPRRRLRIVRRCAAPIGGADKRAVLAAIAALDDDQVALDAIVAGSGLSRVSALVALAEIHLTDGDGEAAP